MKIVTTISIHIHIVFILGLEKKIQNSGMYFRANFAAREAVARDSLLWIFIRFRPFDEFPSSFAKISLSFPFTFPKLVLLLSTALMPPYHSLCHPRITL